MKEQYKHDFFVNAAVCSFVSFCKLKRILLVVLPLLFIATCDNGYRAAQSDEQVNNIMFGYITDIHHNDVGRRAGGVKVEALQKVIDYFDTLPLEFIIHGGDFIDRKTENILYESGHGSWELFLHIYSAIPAPGGCRRVFVWSYLESQTHGKHGINC